MLHAILISCKTSAKTKYQVKHIASGKHVIHVLNAFLKYLIIVQGATIHFAPFTETMFNI